MKRNFPKQNFPNPSRVTATVFTLILLLGTTTTQARPQQATETPAAPIAAGKPNIDQRPRVSVSFPGGTIGQYVQELRVAAAVNIVLDESASDTRIPGIVLNDVPADAAVTMLEKIGNDGIVVANEHSIFLIRRESMAPPASREPPLSLEVISVKQILENCPREDLLSAIEIGMEMLADERPVELKLHSETGLLFLKGTSTQLDTISRIVGQLEQFGVNDQHPNNQNNTNR